MTLKNLLLNIIYEVFIQVAGVFGNYTNWEHTTSLSIHPSVTCSLTTNSSVFKLRALLHIWIIVV